MIPELTGGRYEILYQIGAGGMGEVYRATDWLTGETVALKRIRGASSTSRSRTPSPQSVDPSDQTQTLASTPHADKVDPASRAKRMGLAREFRVLSSLRHPNIIPVLDYGFAAEGDPF